MCENCGCGEGGPGYTLINPAGEPHHDHDHDHPHSHDHDHTHGHLHTHEHQRIRIEADVLQQNNLLAQRNRGYFEARNILALNLVSSPGSGKTTILERTITLLHGLQVYVVEGDQQTSLDADRIHATGAPVIQVNTGNGCHLDAEMVHAALKSLQPKDKALLIIENVGNLVCPALFDLGEQYRIVIISVTEGEDKPLKYPNMFQGSQLCLINKTDLLPHVDFSVEKLKTYARRVNPDLLFFELSAKTGEGFGEWVAWIKEARSWE
jgi:hydrogenase nickel incorporation protein HypB